MERLEAGADETFEALRAYCRSNRKKMDEVVNQIVANRMEIDLSSYLEAYITKERGKNRSC